MRMEHMQAVRLLELNKEFGLHFNNGSSPVTRSNALHSTTTVYVLQGLLSRANDFLCS